MNNYLKIKTELKKYNNLSTDNLTKNDIEDLKYKFRSEETAVWVATAKKIGQLAAKGSDELKSFLQEKLTQHKNIHRLRHALTALGSYYGYCEDEEEKIEFLKRYREPVSIKEKMNARDFIVTEILSRFREDIILGEVIDYFENWDSSQEEVWPKDKDTFELFKKKLLFVVDIADKKKVVESKYGKEIDNLVNLDKAKSYKDLLLFLGRVLNDEDEFSQVIKYLKKQKDGFIDNLIRLWQKEELLTGLSIDNFSVQSLLDTFSIEELKEQHKKIFIPISKKFGHQWYIGSLVYSLDEIYLKEEKINLVIRKLIELGSQNIEYVNNLAYFFLKEIEKNGAETVIEEFENELLLFKNNFKDNKLKINREHFSDFYFDLEFLFELLSQVDDRFNLTIFDSPLSELVSTDIVAKYEKARRSNEEKLILDLLEEIRAKFCAQNEWKKLDYEVQNTVIIFDLIIRDQTVGINYLDKEKIVLKEISNWKEKNQLLLTMFARQLKLLYFISLEKASKDEELFRVAKKQINSIDYLLSQLDWEKTIAKDFASIIINVFDTLWGKEEKGELLLFELIFTVFSYIPAKNIIDQMLYYSKNRELEEMFTGYRECIEDSGENFECRIEGFINVLKKHNISLNTIKVMEELLKQNLIEDNQSFIRSKAFENAILKEELEEKKREIEKERDIIKNLLDNIEQGVLKFGPSLIIDKLYSAQCKEIFGEEIAGRKLNELISDQKLGEDLEFIFEMILNSDESGRRIYQKMLSTEEDGLGFANDLGINDKIIDLDYKIIKDGQVEKIMLILTDITEKIGTKKEIESLQMIVEVLKRPDEFIRLKNKWQSFYQEELPQILELKDKKEILKAISYKIHTFGKKFQEFKILNSKEEIVSFEDELSRKKEDLAYFKIGDLKDELKAIDLIEVFEQDLKIIEDNLGEEFLDRKRVITLDDEKLLELENKFLKLSTGEKKGDLLKEIRALRYCSFKKELLKYKEIIDELAPKKAIEVKGVKGVDVLFAPEVYSDFIFSLRHIFNNIVAHGIEERGKIESFLEYRGEEFVLKIIDNGKGINLEKVKQEALEKGLYTSDLIEEFSDDRLLEIIFEDGFSTAEKVDQLSGRSVGLLAVKEAVADLDGKIKVSSELDVGTEFEFVLPFRSCLLVD